MKSPYKYFKNAYFAINLIVMRLFASLICLSILYTSCVKSIDEQLETEDPMVTVQDTLKSPFDQFLGEWHLESWVAQGDTMSFDYRILVISDDDKSDTSATGYFEIPNNDQDSFTLQFTNEENQLIIKFVDISSTGASRQMLCYYSFLDEATLELDDSIDIGTEISTYRKI